jgi:choline dehydrogenase-like flavoprotein
MLASLDTCDDASLDDSAVCIVGAGAAGITLACELAGAPFKVLLLESGGLHPDETQAGDYAGTANEPHPNPSQYRRFGFGGTTGIWGGRCVPYEPIDFERRDYIANSGWPIAYEDVARHYPRALEYCDAGRFDFAAASAIAQAPPTIEGFDGGGLIDAAGIERYSLPTDFGRGYRGQLEAARNVTVVLGARCVGLIKGGGDDRIEAVEVVDRSGRRRRVRSQAFVLAVGGIETPRLLFASDREGNGLGNRTDRVGRFYACHFENCIGRLVAHGASVAFDFERTTDGVYCRRKLRFTAAAQREHRLLNTAFRLHFPEYSDASHGSAVMSAIYLAKSTLIAEYRDILQHGADLAPAARAAHIRNVVLGMPELAKFGWDWLTRRQLARRKLPYTLVRNADGSFPLEFNAEQTPLERSRIRPIADTDRHGLRRVQVDWFVCEDDIEAAERGFLLLRDTVKARSACRIEFDAAQLRARLAASVPLGGHQIGTTRMAATPREGVVDRHCAVFELPNLYVASSAVFCTSSHANPTLTIVALAIRLAERLKATLAAPQMRQGSIICSSC